MAAGRLTKPGFKADEAAPDAEARPFSCVRLWNGGRCLPERYRQSGLCVMAVDDQEWFAAFPDRRLRMREALRSPASGSP
jgi:hypothetical protein